MQQIISQNIRIQLHTIANHFLHSLIPLRQTQALIVRPDRKLDRLEVKLRKEAEKLNNKQIRSEIKFEGNKPSHRKGSITYKSYTIEFKKKLVASIREELKSSDIGLSKLIRQKARDLGIHPKNITRWYHTKELKKKEGGRRALYPQMEFRLAKFIINNPNLRRKHILRQAKQIMEELQIPGRQEFNFSKGWYERFRDRLSKEKIKFIAKEEDGVKFQVKLQHFQDDQNDENDLKKEQEYSQQEQKTFDSEQDSEDYEDEVKFEEDLSQEERSYNKKVNKARKNKQISLFFEEEDENKANISGQSLFQENQNIVHFD